MSSAPNRADLIDRAEGPATDLRRIVLPALLTLAALVLLVALGNWQMRRLVWKEDLIARAAERPKGPVRELPPSAAWSSLDLADAEYRPFRLIGRFLDEKQAFVFTSLGDPKGPYGGPG